MKSIKNNILIIIFITSAFFAGCNENDFLSEENPNALTADTFWESERQFNSALTTVYGALQFSAISGADLQYEMILGDIAGTENWYRPLAFRNLTYNNGTYYVTDKWNELYIGIFRANQVIQYIQKNDGSSFVEYNKNEIEAQARFLRAFFYFQLANTYNGAVIHTEVGENSEDLSKPFSDRAEVTSSIIIPDLEFAMANLPQTWESDNDKGRVTWGSATSLLGKVYLYNKDFLTAANLFKQVIESGIYSLTPNIMDNFTDENEFNSESIFEVAFSADINPGVNGDNVDSTPYVSGAEATALARALGHLDFGGYNTLLVSYYLHELYTNDEVDPTNPINDGNTYTRRMTSSIATKYDETTYYGEEIETLPIGRYGQSAYVKKHTNWYHLNAEDSNNRSGINFRHIRYADVLLMYAEAVLESSGDYATAIQYIDMVRRRAGAKTLQQYMDENMGMFPELHISKEVHGNQPLVTANAETVMQHLRRVERPLELAFEGHRWKDLVRWGIVQEVFTELRADEVWRENNAESILGQAPLYYLERIRPDFVLSSQNYSSSQHDYLPIPTQEVQTNDNI